MGRAFPRIYPGNAGAISSNHQFLRDGWGRGLSVMAAGGSARISHQDTVNGRHTINEANKNILWIRFQRAYWHVPSCLGAHQFGRDSTRGSTRGHPGPALPTIISFSCQRVDSCLTIYSQGTPVPKLDVFASEA